MIVDSSAVLAIMFDEPEATDFARGIALSERCRMSAVNWFETTMVLETRGDSIAARRFDDLIATMNIDVVAFTPDHAEVARDAWRRFGRGRHPARLNFGDCMACALAADEREPLLFKGNDFSKTDITPALSS